MQNVPIALSALHPRREMAPAHDAEAAARKAAEAALEKKAENVVLVVVTRWQSLDAIRDFVRAQYRQQRENQRWGPAKLSLAAARPSAESLIAVL